MLEVFNNLDTLLKGFWMVAIPTSVIFIIQMTLTFIGSDASDGTSADFDGDLDGGDTPFQLFSFRNLMNFLLGFSWTGISFYKIINNHNFSYCSRSFVCILIFPNYQSSKETFRRQYFQTLRNYRKNG